MNDFMAGDFPRIHTAIAEWLACVVLLAPLKKKDFQWRNLILLLILPATLFGTFYAMEQLHAQGILWAALMALGMLQMMAVMLIACRPGWTIGLYFWAHGFLMAEMAASLEWQINYYLIKIGVITSVGQTYVCMTLVYLLVFTFAYFLRKRKTHGVNKISAGEAFSAVGIAIGAFIISNMQFAVESSWFSSRGDGVLYARTLVDISGLLMLFANGEQRREIALRYELDAMTNLLNRQYEQYRQFEANNEAMHRVYHDLKHQIAYLEGETSKEKRMAGLKEMKEIIRTSESAVSTENTVLDTVLTSKSLICAEEGIALSCYADGRLVSFMDVMDICSVFGNTIDNAIEYERGITNPDDRLIKVYVGSRGAFLLIRIENYCEKPVDLSAGAPATTKEDKHMHGYGLKSVRHSVEKYQGHLKLEQKDGWFKVTILIPMPKKDIA